MTPDRHWAPDDNQKVLIRRAAEILKAKETPYADLAIIYAMAELNLDTNPGAVERLGHLAFLEAAK